MSKRNLNFSNQSNLFDISDFHNYLINSFASTKEFVPNNYTVSLTKIM